MLRYRYAPRRAGGGLAVALDDLLLGTRCGHPLIFFMSDAVNRCRYVLLFKSV